MKKTTFAAFVLLGGLAIATGSYIGYLSVNLKELPEIRALEAYRPPTVTRIYSEDDRLVAQLFLEKRIIVPASSVPRHLKLAILSVEDAEFYDHPGIDFFGIARALFADIKAGQIIQGGSTITQQLTKLLFLKPERSIKRKLKEALLAFLIEMKYTKDEIFELYLNQIYLGGGAYGVEAAAQTYFSKSASQLSLAEAAMIAGLPRAPNYYSPFKNRHRALQRRNHVLNRMAELGFISQTEAQEAALQPLKFTSPPKENPAAYFVEYVRQYLEDRYGSERIYKGGLEVRTTVNIELQTIAQNALRKGLQEFDKRQGYRPLGQAEGLREIKVSESSKAHQAGDRVEGRVVAVDPKYLRVELDGQIADINLKAMEWARIKDPTRKFKVGDRVLVQIIAKKQGASGYEAALDQEPEVEGAILALDPNTGYIKAMAGGYDFARSQFNRAVQAKRQPGSAFKPFIYTAAILSGFTAADIIDDAPIVYSDPVTGRVWEPKNFDDKFQGLVTLRNALEHSRNAATISLLQKVGINKVIEVARKMGVESPLAQYLSLGLGSSDLALLEITSAYSTLANGGLRVSPMAIRYIEDENGQLLEKNTPKADVALSPQVAYVVTDMMKGVIKNGTGWRARELKKPMAGKTGTTNDYRDAWFIGFTPTLAAGVWVGFDDQRPLGSRETGARAASPIWVELMRGYFQLGGPAPDFLVPDGITFAEIDDEKGLIYAPNCAKVELVAFIKGTEPKLRCGGEEAYISRAEQSDSESF